LQVILCDKYNESILTLAILTDDNKIWHPKNYQKQVCGFPVLTFNFQTCKLLDYRDHKQELEDSINPFGIVILAHLAAMNTKRNPQARYELKFSLTRRLYEKGHGRDYVINLFKMIDWVLVIPKELELEYRIKIHELEEAGNVSYITSIERLGREEGLQQGFQKGVKSVEKIMRSKGLDQNTIKEILELSKKELEHEL
jgi:uncharacterized protein (UPF0335 family)